MFFRPIFSELETHLAEHEVSVITGMRRTGKTTALKYLLEATPHKNKLYLDLERLEYRRIFTRKSFSEMQADIEFLGYDFSQKGIIAIDEVQLIPEVVSFIKYYHDNFPVKFLVTGSSSYYLKNRITESLAGRKRVFEMFPLDFLEFLNFKSVDTKPLATQRMKSFRPLVFATYQQYYEEYLRYGGFPQVVLADSPEKKEKTLSDILNSYLELDIKIISDYSVIDDLFKLATLLSARIGNKLDYQKIGVLTGLNRHKVKDYIQLFRATYFLHLIEPYSINPDRSIAVQPKIFISDNGLVNRFAQVGSGALFENAIANQLLRLGKVNYFQKKTGQEIDFILNENKAIEVKETPGAFDLKMLESRAAGLGIENRMLIGRFPPGVDFHEFVWGGCIF
ncbi:MAG: ATP-binding protein [Saprospiraceae bacterium]|nr:ATP-binding protein [Saprospiraceae bacterium]